MGDLNMSMEHWWNNTDEKPEVLCGQLVLVPLCPPQIPQLNPILRGENSSNSSSSSSSVIVVAVG